MGNSKQIVGPSGRTAGCGCIAVLLLGVALVSVIITALSVTNAVQDQGDSRLGDEYRAKVGCSSEVVLTLVSPSTAKFSSTTATTDGSGTWTVRGTVDSDNPYGSTVRSYYGCSVTLEGSSSRTTIEFVE